jgi:uncharacterized phage protein (TIGR01671 family)
MREILFRGKQEYKNKEWAFGSLHSEYGETDKNGQRKIDYRILGMRGECDYVLPETVGQFTGLTDKNGKKIFEGDIVRVCLDPEICVGDVIWYSEIASYNIPFNNGKCVLPLDIFIAKNKVGDKVWIEVIGNIHDNPELLGGAEDVKTENR